MESEHSVSRGVFIVAKRRRCEIEDPSEIEQIQGIKVSPSAGENSPSTFDEEEEEEEEEEAEVQLPPQQDHQHQQQQQQEVKNHPLDLELGGYMCMDGQVPVSATTTTTSSPSSAPPPPPPPPAAGSTSTTSTTTTTPNHLNNTTSGSSSSSQKASTPLSATIKTESIPPLVVDHQHHHTGPVPVLIPSNPSFSSAMSPPPSGGGGGGGGTSIMIHTSNNSNTVQNVAGGATTTTTATTMGAASGAYAHLLGLGQVKRKRGRPRKYVETGTGGGGTPVFLSGTGTVPVVTGFSALQGSPPPVLSSPATPGGGGGMALALAPLAASAAHGQLPFALAASPSTGGGQPERKRGRPPGTGKKQQLAALGAFLAQAGTTGQGFTGQGFTPHVITIAAGEDVATKIITFAQIGTRTTCVLSANGVISNVTLRQPATSGGTVTYEGRFEILSLTGSFLLTETGNTRSRSGGLSVSLAGPDGRVIGGGVAGLLIAATPVQVVVGSFITESRKPVVHVPVNRPHSGSSNDMLAGAAGGISSPMSITRPAVLNESNNTSSQMTWSRSQDEHQQTPPPQQQQQHQQHHQQQQQQQSHSQQQEQEQQQNPGQGNEGHGTDINILPTS